EVGGDYYDFFTVDRDHLGMVCADVSGKGIPGSMVMMMAKALITSNARRNYSPRDVFIQTNQVLAKDIKRGMFVTAYYALLDASTRELRVSSAGHNAMLIFRSSTGEVLSVNPSGIALGFDRDGALFEKNVKEEVVELRVGDRVVIYTDGVTEATNAEGEEFGEDRLKAVMKKYGKLPSTEFLVKLVGEIENFAKTDTQHDDITILTFLVKA
ncbi:MAG: serine/threonine-protein phosphatase, partial [Planctomycetes bacterium]|nr:serine/threonine-protein phosphatase [Planctomycetota bacterium]